MSKYTIEDITDRLQDLQNYIEDLEQSLDCVKDAADDLATYAQDLEERVNLPTIPEAEELQSELLDYMAAHRHEWDYRTERFFNRLDWLVMQTIDDSSPVTDEHGNFISVKLAVSPQDLQTLLHAMESALNASAAETLLPHQQSSQRVATELMHRRISTLLASIQPALPKS